MKKLILIIALLCISTSALAVEPIDFSKSYALTAIQAAVSAGGAAAASCTSCTSSNDGSIVGFTGTYAGSSNAVLYYAFPFTTSTVKCITGVAFGCTDDANANGSATVEVWTNVSGSPGEIYGAGYTKTLADLADAPADTEFLFAACQTLPAGDYWAVFKRTESNARFSYVDGGAGWKSSTNGTTWTADTGYQGRGWVLGCDPS
jgi:hypothetical protein